MANKLNFSVSDKLVIDGNDGLSVDMTIEWGGVDLATPISIDSNGKAHPFVDGETFAGILSGKFIKNAESEVAGVNSIEVSYLKGGYFFWALSDGALAIGDGVEPTAKGFKKATADANIKGYAVTVGTDGLAVKIRGGNY